MKYFHIFLALGIALIGVEARADSLLFLSTQFNPVNEAAAMRNDILPGSGVEVDFQAWDDRALFQQLVAGQDANTKASLVGAVRGDFLNLSKKNLLVPVDGLMGTLGDRDIPKKLTELAKLGTDRQLFVPWAQATYILAANKKALEYLPKGADLNNLTYAQLAEWGDTLKSKTGSTRIGFPAGRGGLMHRFFQGYLYPSFTGGMVTGFRSKEAVGMWESFRTLWATVSTRSLTYASMSDPLLSEEIWVAWDHVARLKEALRQRPDNFVTFPSPRGPKGRGYMVVLAGLGIPATVQDRPGAERLITHLTKPETQAMTLLKTGFFPVVKIPVDELPSGLAAMAKAVSLQASLPGGVPSVLPVLVGERSGEFNVAYMTTFSRIILRKHPISDVLGEQAAKIQGVLNSAKAGCWPPDTPSQSVCTIR